MNKPIIAVDIDDVLADSTESLRLVVNQQYGIDILPEHYHVPGEYHGYYDRVWEAQGYGGLVDFEALSAQMEVDQSHVPAQPDALRVLKKLAKSYELVVITARNESWQQATHIWLLQNYPGVFSEVYFGGSRHHAEEKTKGDLCVEVGATWLIDDNMEHCRTAIDRGVAVVLFGEYGWHMDVPVDVVRCKDWKAIGKYFDER